MSELQIQDSRVGRVYCCQPGYANGSPASHKAFWTGGSKPNGAAWNKTTYVHGGSSLLANSFNIFWTHALNMQLAGEKLTHFAMLHDDIVPEDGWLDKLLELLLEYDLDILSAVVPIKDPLGITSTAIGPRWGNRFEMERRLTMTEVHTLPPVFSVKDCGYDPCGFTLLLNTGCWVCKFTEPWREKVHFTIDDRIRLKDGKWYADVASEDWNFSRLLAKLGVEPHATRAVPLVHVGQIPYPNGYSWGEWDCDKVLGDKFNHQPIRGAFYGSTHDIPPTTERPAASSVVS